MTSAVRGVALSGNWLASFDNLMPVAERYTAFVDSLMAVAGNWLSSVESEFDVVNWKLDVSC